MVLLAPSVLSANFSRVSSRNSCCGKSGVPIGCIWMLWMGILFPTLLFSPQLVRDLRSQSKLLMCT